MITLTEMKGASLDILVDIQSEQKQSKTPPHWCFLHRQTLPRKQKQTKKRRCFSLWLAWLLRLWVYRECGKQTLCQWTRTLVRTSMSGSQLTAFQFGFRAVLLKEKHASRNKWSTSYTCGLHCEVRPSVTGHLVQVEQQFTACMLFGNCFSNTPSSQPIFQKQDLDRAKGEESEKAQE